MNVPGGGGGGGGMESKEEVCGTEDDTISMIEGRM